MSAADEIARTLYAEGVHRMAEVPAYRAIALGYQASSDADLIASGQHGVAAMVMSGADIARLDGLDLMEMTEQRVHYLRNLGLDLALHMTFRGERKIDVALARLAEQDEGPTLPNIDRDTGIRETGEI